MPSSLDQQGRGEPFSGIIHSVLPWSDGVALRMCAAALKRKWEGESGAASQSTLVVDGMECGSEVSLLMPQTSQSLE